MPRKRDTDHPSGGDGYYRGRHVVLTGYSGFVGNRLARELLAAGASVTALTRAGGGSDWRVRDLQGRVEMINADLCDPAGLRTVLEELWPSALFHLATYYSADDRVDLGEVVDVNIKAAVALVQACEGLQGLDLFVNTGTCAEYGDFRGTADEQTPITPASIYASTKAAGTICAGQLARDLGVPLVTLRLYNMYGEYESPSRIVPAVLLALLRGEVVPLTAGEQAKDYSYVGDIVRAFMAAPPSARRVAGEIVNIGSGSTVTMRAFVETLASKVGADMSLLHFGEVAYRPNEMWHQGTSIGKARELLGWEPALSLDEGLALVADWYRDNAHRYE